MSWTDIFKSKSKARPDPRIRWFGKLPTYPDYYSSHADEDWAVEFNEWVLKGFQIYQTRLAGSAPATTRLPVCGTIIRLPKSEMTVISSILDFGGDMRGRPFPICFYVGVPTALWPGPTNSHVAAAMRTVRDLEALRREVARFINSPGRFETVFGDRQVDLSCIEADQPDDSWMSAGASVALEDWFNGAKDRLKIKDRSSWLRCVTNWGEQLAAMDGKSFEPTLRFPLASKLPLDVQVAGWLRWLEPRLALRQRSLSLIVSGNVNDESGDLTIVARSVVPDDFLLLTSKANMLPYLDDLTQTEATEPAGGSPSLSVLDSLVTWVDFVKADPAAS